MSGMHILANHRAGRHSHRARRKGLARVGLAVTTRLDQQELDDALTNGEPRRLRLVAVRTAVPPSLPAARLDAAVRALRDYQRRQHGHLARVLSNVFLYDFRRR
jgi:hypothetical protein